MHYIVNHFFTDFRESTIIPSYMCIDTITRAAIPQMKKIAVSIIISLTLMLFCQVNSENHTFPFSSQATLAHLPTILPLPISSARTNLTNPLHPSALAPSQYTPFHLTEVLRTLLLMKTDLSIGMSKDKYK